MAHTVRNTGNFIMKESAYFVTLIAIGFFLLTALLVFNGSSDWIRSNGGLAAWLQAIGSIYAIFAVSFPVFLERRIALNQARHSVLASAHMAYELMSTVANRAFDPDARFSEWWVPQWHVIGETMASCPIHEIHSPKALEAFITIRELYDRMKAWDESSDEGWPSKNNVMHGYIGNICINASMQLETLKTELS